MKTRVLQFILACQLSGCLTVDTERVDVEGHAERLIGGVRAEHPLFDVIGSLSRARSGTRQPAELICTATLIGAASVLTAKHCADDVLEAAAHGDSHLFSIGAQALAPRRSVRITGGERAPGDTGGWNGLGSDVAVLHLEEPIRDVTPLSIAALPLDRLGDTFLGVGFGVHDLEAHKGVRYAGLLRLRATAGFTYGALLGGFEAYYAWYTGKPAADGCSEPDAGAEAAAACPIDVHILRHYQRTRLEDVGELVLGGGPDEAQPCHGDSGGPLLGVDAQGELRVYGVASGGIGSASQRCDHGAVYAGFPAAVHAFVQEAAARIAPCDHTPAAP